VGEFKNAKEDEAEEVEAEVEGEKLGKVPNGC